MRFLVASLTREVHRSRSLIALPPGSHMVDMYQVDALRLDTAAFVPNSYLDEWRLAIACRSLQK